MSRPLLVLRPSPGAEATAARIVAAGHEPIVLPLFETHAVPWIPPPAAQHDALLLTSANAVRLGGPGLSGLRALPVYAVGPATARAAREAGLAIAATGDSDGAELARLAEARGVRRGLLLCGRDRALDVGGAIARAVIVYASEALAIDADRLALAERAIVLLHSPRAARRFDELAAAARLDRRAIRIATLSEAVARAAGHGWGDVRVAPQPSDAALIATAIQLTD
ncbi:MAG TPA: uroporphyrinogen-III synthase [Sphingomonas sp.]|nr:uroporphyrinogen-III synthase [Sphingomonas sp.]